VLKAMALLKRKSSNGAQKTPFKQRFMAWWEGVELPPMESPLPPAVREVVPEPPPPPVKLEPWENPAIRVRQAIWGEGFRSPGGSAFALELVKPFAINNSMSILDFGCGAGGPARTIAKEFDVWITGIERDRDLVDLGKLLSTKAGMERKAEVIAYDPENFVTRSGGFDCIYSIETLYRFPAREVILARLENVLKTRGQMTVADYVRGDDTAPDDARIAAALGEGTPALWTKTEYEKRFNELKFDLRVSEDITDKYRLRTLLALDQVTKVPEGKSVIRTFPDAFMAEVDDWHRRLTAIEAGALRVFRFYGIKMGTASLMSNWS
jgi:cyclopropane fatty-acyl-phospholipid synthase-like methyltransferase